jgi:hypothetical protein
MERAFAIDLSQVRVRETDSAAMGAGAYVQGNEIHFAPTTYDPTILGHELAHVVQQRAGRASGPEG